MNVKFSRGARRLFLLTFFVAFAAFAASSWAASAEAAYSRIPEITGVPSLKGERLSGYEAELIAGAQASLELRATADGAGSGTQIEWTVDHVQGGAVGWTASPAGGVSYFPSGNTSQFSVLFYNPAPGSVYRITAQLQDLNGASAGPNAVIRVSFVNPVPLSGVTLDKTEMSVRQGGGKAYLTATPSPGDATAVIYSWESDNPAVAAYTTLPGSNDSVLVTGAYPGYTARIRVSAVGYGNAAYNAECDVTVVEHNEIADDMKIKPSMGSAEEVGSTGLYAVDSSFVYEAYNGMNESVLRASSGYPSSTPRYILTAGGISPTPLVNVDRAYLGRALGLEKYESNLAAALRLDLNMSPPMLRGDMLPLILSFRLNRLSYLDGSAAANPTSAKDFHDKYRIVKHFGSSGARYSIDISDVLNSKSSGSYVKLENGAARIVPLLAFVDDAAPDSSDRRVGDQNQYGVKYDSANQILFIYDGQRDAKISDPITLERRDSSGGGGGGGCDAGFGAAALLLAAGAFAVLKAKKN